MEPALAWGASELLMRAAGLLNLVVSGCLFSVEPLPELGGAGGLGGEGGEGAAGGGAGGALCLDPSSCFGEALDADGFASLACVEALDPRVCDEPQVQFASVELCDPPSNQDIKAFCQGARSKLGLSEARALALLFPSSLSTRKEGGQPVGYGDACGALVPLGNETGFPIAYSGSQVYLTAEFNEPGWSGRAIAVALGIDWPGDALYVQDVEALVGPCGASFAYGADDVCERKAAFEALSGVDCVLPQDGEVFSLRLRNAGGNHAVFGLLQQLAVVVDLEPSP